MDVVYWSEYSAISDSYRFYALLNAQIEMETVGSVVSLVLGFYDTPNEMWDWMKCDVRYDGDVNTVARSYTVTDRYSFGPDLPHIKGTTDEAMPLDSQQDWQISQSNSKSTCPYLQKCVFQCAATRLFETDDSRDFNFKS
jgi:hypothetical protein